MSVTILENALDASWTHKLRIMAGKADALDAQPLPAHAQSKRFEDDIHLHHLDASWPARELVRVPLGNSYRLVVAWWIGDGKVSAAMLEAGTAYALAFGVDPEFAFVRRLPEKAPEFVEVKGISLVQAGWVPDGFLAVTSGGMWRNLPAINKEVVSV